MTIVGTMNELICTACNDFSGHNYNSGSFTQVEAFPDTPALICLKCKQCAAIKQESIFCSIDSLLVDRQEPQRQGWLCVRNEQDALRHAVLSRVIYRLNESPDPSKFECEFALPDYDLDQTFLLWVQGKAAGFATLRSPIKDMRVVDTVFVRKECRGQGQAQKLVAQLVATLDKDVQLGFSNPVSDGMLKVILKFLADGQNKRVRERIWLVKQEDRQVLWWAAFKLCKQRGIDIKKLLNK